MISWDDFAKVDLRVARIVAAEEVFDEKGVRLPLMISVTVTDASVAAAALNTTAALLSFTVQRRSPDVAPQAALAADAAGRGGFGYDPLFLPDGHTRTFGEMTSDEKHGLPPRGKGLSHRARAFLMLAEACLGKW